MNHLPISGDQGLTQRGVSNIKIQFGGEGEKLSFVILLSPEAGVAPVIERKIRDISANLTKLAPPPFPPSSPPVNFLRWELLLTRLCSEDEKHIHCRRVLFSNLGKHQNLWHQSL